MHLYIPVNSKDHSQGNIKAAIVLVEYGDYECPYCGAAYPVVKQLQEHFGEDLLFVFRNFPLTELHPHALSAAYFTEAAASQGKFWQLHDLIFENQQGLSAQSLIKLAKQAETNIPRLQKEISSQGIIEKVETDIEGGLRSGVNGTPTFFVNGKRFDQDYDYETMKSFLASV